ncbi:MAG TPA: 7TM diverse intracellular signaling domain-containing protein, partial [Puia sp.]|nr:7TM diverse intracellular signaling domain-containing protein [Puia sp.]
IDTVGGTATKADAGKGAENIPGMDADIPVGRAFNTPYADFIHQMDLDPRPYIFWQRFGLQNRTGRALDFSLYCGYLDYADLYFISPGRPVRRVSGGNLRRPPAGSTYAQRRSAVLPLRLAPYESGQLFLKIRQRTDEYDFSGLSIYDPDTLNASFVQELMDGGYYPIIQALFQGFLLCQLLYVLFQWLMVRRREYLYYFFYMAAISLYFLSKEERPLGMELLFTRFPLLKIYLGKTLLILPYFLYFRFVRSFLEMQENYPVLNKWIRWSEYFLLGYMVFDFVFILLTLNRKLQTQVYTFVLLMVFLLAARFIVYMYRRRKTLVSFIISGSLFVATGNILGLIFSYLQFNLHLDMGVPDIFVFSQLGIVLEIFCFTAGLSYKAQASEKEKIKSQERLIEQLKANELLQTRMQSIRNKIAQDLHDDIGSTLSSISILSDLALKEKNSGQTLLTMSEIKDSSLLLMERMDDIVWSINPRNDSLENLLIRVKHFATTLFEAREIDYTIHIQDNIHQVRLPMDFRQHIYLVLKEAINNLVKYARATQADIRVSFDHRVLALSVKDNGCGFGDSRKSTGNGIPGMQRRAALMNAALDIRSGPGEGTEIILRVDIP